MNQALGEMVSVLLLPKTLLLQRLVALCRAAMERQHMVYFVAMANDFCSVQLQSTMNEASA